MCPVGMDLVVHVLLMPAWVPITKLWSTPRLAIFFLTVCCDKIGKTFATLIMPSVQFSGVQEFPFCAITLLVHCAP